MSIKDIWLKLCCLARRVTALEAGGGGGGGGSGTVTSVSVTTANGVSGSVATATTTPAISLTLGAITPTSVTASGNVTGANLSGTNTGDQTSVTGNAGTATALQTARTINGVSFNGTADITVTAAAGTLSGTTLNASVVTSSLTSVGVLTTGTWSADTIALNKGGTGATTAAGVRGVLGLAAPSTNITDATGARTLALTDANQLLQFTHATATTITVPTDASVLWSGAVPVPEIFIQRGTSAGPLAFSAPGVTINNNTVADLPAGRYGVLRWKSSNVWDWMGGGSVAWADITGKAVEICIACSDETTAIAIGTGKATFRAPFAFTLTAVRASVNTAPTGATILIDINEAGVSVLSTRLMIDASEKTSQTSATPAVISDSAIADDAEISIDFDQVGTTIAGAGVKVWLIGTR